MSSLTEAQTIELLAIEEVTSTLQKPTMLHRALYNDPVVGGLVRRGLIRWKARKNSDMRDVTLTKDGRRAARTAKAAIISRHLNAASESLDG